MIFLYLGLAAGVIVLDQLTKMYFFGKSFSLIGDFLWIDSSFNTGAAFSMMSGARWFFILVAIISSIVIIYLLFSKRWHLTITNKIALSMILGGAIGNVIDRIWLYGVRDFIYFKSINYAIFNFADTFVTIGGVLLVASVIIEVIISATKKNTNSKGNTDDTK